MADKILVIGSGYLGGRLARHLLREGYNVDATTRSHEKAKAMDGLGIRPILTELTTAKGFGEFDQYDSIVLCPAPDQGHAAAYQDLFETGFERLITYLHFHPPKKSLIYTSSVGVYEEKEGNWVTEETPTPGSNPRTRSLVEAETFIKKSSFKTVILRLGGIYGPGRNRINAVKEGSVPTVDLDGFVNMVFIEDAVNAARLALHSESMEGIFNVVDDEPVQRRVLWSWLADKLEKPFSPENAASESAGRGGNKRCSNQKIKESGLTFSFPTFREGYENLLASFINPSEF